MCVRARTPVYLLDPVDLKQMAFAILGTAMFETPNAGRLDIQTRVDVEVLSSKSIDRISSPDDLILALKALN